MAITKAVQKCEDFENNLDIPSSACISNYNILLWIYATFLSSTAVNFFGKET